MGSIFKNLKTTALAGDFSYVGKGRYWARIDKVKHDKTRKKVEFISIEMTILTVIPGNEPADNRVGEEVNRFIQISGSDYAEKDFVQFLCGTLGLSPSELPEGADDWACADDQPLRGVVVEMDNKVITLESGKLFTKVKFCREVPVAEVLNNLPPELVNRFFPNNFLGNKLAAEKA